MKDNVYPGEIWGANSQCQIFLLDSDAHMDHNEADFQVSTLLKIDAAWPLIIQQNWESLCC